MDKFVYALGTFDGVHTGHRKLVSVCKELAAELGVLPAVYTFTALPRATVEARRIGMLVTTQQKQGLLRAAGAQKVVAEPFEKVRALSPEEFIYYLIGAFGAEGFVCGRDFRFGKGGEGDVCTLHRICKAVGKTLRVVDFVEDARGEKISSARIRTYIEQGKPELAAESLGRPFFLEGKVIDGKGLARKWGTPTINLPLPEALVRPRYGVYATRAVVAGKEYPAVTNVGIRPTLDDGDHPTVETYILEGNFEKIDELRVEFLHFLRPEMTFPDEKSLQMQIAKDIQSCKDLW